MKSIHFVLLLYWIILATHTFKFLIENEHKNIVFIFFISLISPVLYIVMEIIVGIVCIADFIKTVIKKNRDNNKNKGVD